LLPTSKTVIVRRPAPTVERKRNKNEKYAAKQKGLSRKLSAGSAQAFASLTQLPVKLKNAIGKKNRGRSSLKGATAASAVKGGK